MPFASEEPVRTGAAGRPIRRVSGNRDQPRRSEDVDAVPYAIGRRARMLIGTDASYLTLLENEDTEQRYTRGDRQYQRRELPGRVRDGVRPAGADHRQPPDDRGPRRRPPFSTRDQRRRCGGRGRAGRVLAVPVLLHGAAVGILSAADRHRRTFEAREISPLASLAAHTGVAFESAQLFESAEHAPRELRLATPEAQRRREGTQRSAELHVLDHDGRNLAGTTMDDGSEPTPWLDIAAGSDALGTLLVQGIESRMLERTAQVIAFCCNAEPPRSSPGSSTTITNRSGTEPESG